MSDQMFEPAPRIPRWINESNKAKLVKFPTNQIQMPFSEEAEMATIGAVLTNPNALALIDFLKAEDFFLLRHTYIWRAIEVLEQDPQIGINGIDFLSVAEELKRHNLLETVGNSAYLVQLINNTPSSANVETYARLVQRAATRRRMMIAADSIKELALDDSLNLDAAVDTANRILFESTDQQLDDEPTLLSDLIGSYFADFEDQMNSPKQLGIPSGLRAFDKKFGGLHRGEVVMVAGRTGTGKTTFCLNVVANAARIGLSSAIFSQEMSKDEIIRKFLSMETGIHEQRLKMRTDIDVKTEWPLIVEAMGRIKQWPVYIVDDMPGLTPLQFKRRYRKFELHTRIDLAFIDGLWLMEDDKGGSDNQYTKFSPIMEALAIDAKLNRKRILITHQYNRNSGHRDNKRPVEDDILGGGTRGAYLILGLYRDPKTPDVTDTEVITLKHRGSEAAGSSITVGFLPQSSRYVDKGGAQ